MVGLYYWTLLKKEKNYWKKVDLFSQQMMQRVFLNILVYNEFQDAKILFCIFFFLLFLSFVCLISMIHFTIYLHFDFHWWFGWDLLSFIAWFIYLF